jgi:hypothetical protein
MAITTRNQVFTNLAQGLGYWCPIDAGGGPPGNTGAAVIASGNLSLQIWANAIGTAQTSGAFTLTGFQLPAGLPAQLVPTLQFVRGAAACGWVLCRLYRFGTLNLAASANTDCFTHDSTFTSLSRTQLGQATQTITLTPIVVVTTTLTTTAAVLQLTGAAGSGSGYVNQNGVSQTGNLATNFTFPSTTTAVGSAFVLRLNNGDSGVQNITHVNLPTAAGAGAASVYGMEVLATIPNPTATPIPAAHDCLFGGFNLMDLTPATPNSGTVTSLLVLIRMGSTGPTGGNKMLLSGVLNQ